MTSQELLSLSINYGFAMMGLSVLLVVYRLLRGPSRADRVVAMDFLTVLALSFAGLYALAVEQRVYLDIVIAIALIGFVATLAYARYVEWRGGMEHAKPPRVKAKKKGKA